ncbi:hypothetical protein BWI93_01005 [Siphonobacter sp. BAB-5385]|uniref:hypothetical protein n=1 Tax=Siphonobacter sp. BAB-5385 TaxID=1864822 RepID=UPI000B9EBB12|nr:hypothetical protein [Siphonobacter sp. BAB-5385]OZI09949.1 hypothetical protein BWI93_01005 [Siphonobacter sp. BAB-5385]
MAGIAATVFDKAVIMAKDKFTEFENRNSLMGSYMALREGTNQLVTKTALEKARTSQERQVTIPVLKRYNATVHNQRGLNLPGDEPESDLVTLNWFTRGFTVKTREAVHQGNYISEAEYIAHQIQNGLRAVYQNNLVAGKESFDKMATDYLNASKTTALATTTLAGVTIAGGAYEIPQDKLYIYMPTLFMKNELQGPFHDVANYDAMAMRTYMSTMGSANQQNLEKLLSSQYDFGYSPHITVPANTLESHYMFGKGSYGVLDWIEYDCRSNGGYDGKGSWDGTYKYTTWEDPYGALWGVLVTMGPNESTIPGLERSYAMQMDFFKDTAFVKSYSSEAGKSETIKVNVKAPSTASQAA